MKKSLHYKKTLIVFSILGLLSVLSPAAMAQIGVRVGNSGGCIGPNGAVVSIRGITVGIGNCSQYGGTWQSVMPQYVGPGQTNAPVRSVNQFLEFLVWLISLAQVIFWIFTVGFGLYAAYLYLFSGGSSESVAKAHKMLIYTAIAAVVSILAYTIPGIVDSVFR